MIWLHDITMDLKNKNNNNQNWWITNRWINGTGRYKKLYLPNTGLYICKGYFSTT
jgi:hypothetical protein